MLDQSPLDNYEVSPQEATDRLGAIKMKIELAAQKSGRKTNDISLLAVSKTFSAAAIKTYFQLGVVDFAESYIQEAKGKIVYLNSLNLTYHFIGHLQTNKAKQALELFQIIHSVDSITLGAELNRRAEKLNRPIDIYLQVNVSGELSKSGFAPENLPKLLDETEKMPHLKVLGLMTMPPYDPDPELSRPYFEKLRQLRDQCAPHLNGLSMGMSGDFQVAIEEGATVVRIGSSLFGHRN
ncbi:MAG: YggS family pyridoxal phosphate-dependent enzyme [Candidatus Adiutrix sp.]